MSFKKFMKDENANTVIMLVGISVAILILAVILTVAPIVGYNVDSAVTVGANSSWDTSCFACGARTATNASELWTQNSPMLAVAALIAIVGVIIAVLMGVSRQD